MKKNERIYANIEINQALNDKNNIFIFFQKFLNITTVINDIVIFAFFLSKAKKNNTYLLSVTYRLKRLMSLLINKSHSY